MTEIQFTITGRSTLGGVLRRVDVDQLAEHLASLLAGEHHVNHMDITVKVTYTRVVWP